MVSILSEQVREREITGGGHLTHDMSDTSNQICARCGGLLVGHTCMDLLNSDRELECATLRCIQCGDIVDPVILHHRRLRQNRQCAEPGGTSAFSPELW